MNKKEYLKNKKLTLSTDKVRAFCQHCYRPLLACFCNPLKTISPNAKICILMHPKEARRSQIGTGRMAHIALKNSELIIDSSFDQNPHFLELLNSSLYTAMLLYPGAESVNLSNALLKINKPLLIFVLDGSWPCAKSMMKKTKKLHSLPRISFSSDNESRFEIKQQPAKYCLSTIESIHSLLSALEKQNLESLGKSKDILLKGFKKMVSFHQDCAADPSRNSYLRKSCSPKKVHERIPSKKWERRNICFKE